MRPERDWMRLAVDLAKLSMAEERPDPPPKVGAVLVRDGEVVATAYRGQRNPGDHAEYCLLSQLDSEDLKGTDLFTTLEPCSRRQSPKRPCCDRVAEAGIATVWIGLYDPNPRIFREGWRVLRDSGVVLRDFDADLRAELSADNVAFLDGFRTTVADAGTASLDILRNGGAHVVTAGGKRFATRWSSRGDDSVWAYGNEGDVASARYARTFEEVDEPGALDYSSDAVGVAEGEIVSFRSGREFLLVQVTEVSDLDRGADRSELRIRWQRRAARQSS